MAWGLALLGALIGLMIGTSGAELLGLALGALAGALMGQFSALRRRVAELESVRQTLPRAPAPEVAPQPPSRPPPPPPARVADRPAAEIRPIPATMRKETAPVAAPGRLDIALRLARQWLTTGNVPVKIGVIVSFFGVAFLLKYAVDRRLITFPIEFRLLSVAAAAAVLLAAGWRLRTRARTYALSLQGGGLGILYLVTFSAFRLYDLIPQLPAFVLLVGLTAAGGALAVLQNARGLAVLGAAGGFLAPILVSTGTGSHVVLFSYYLVLNALILGVAWFRPWRELNLLGFLFTFVIGGFWAWRRYEPGMYASTQPFVVLFFLFYQAVAILYARRGAATLRSVVDGTLVFATPVLAFAMQAVMLRHTEFGLAYSAVAAALFYALVATWLDRAGADRTRLLMESYLALGVAFATLAIPLALDARWTAAGWALEGAALAWVGRRQGRLLARLAGALLVVAAGVSFMRHGWQALEGPPVLNGNLLGGLLIAASAFFAARQLERAGGGRRKAEILAARLLVAFGAAWWAVTGCIEIAERAADDWQQASVTLWFATGAALVTAIARRLDWPAAGATSLVLPLAMLLLLAAQTAFGGHPLGAHGWLAWPVALTLQFWVLRRQSAVFPRLTAISHGVVAVLATLLLMAEVFWQVDRATFGRSWPLAAAAFVPGLVWLAIHRLQAAARWPVAEFPGAYARGAGLALLALQALSAAALNATSNGDAIPLPYVPVANPVDLATLFALLCVWHWLRATGHTSRPALVWLGATAFVASTLALLRAVHQFGGVPWQFDSLAGSVLVQAALSVYWGGLAFAGMVLGARRRHRAIWMTGAALMGIVVAKLFLVELGNTGTVARIVSFIAVGALLLVVGYVAPAPPRKVESVDG